VFGVQSIVKRCTALAAVGLSIAISCGGSTRSNASGDRRDAAADPPLDAAPSPPLDAAPSPPLDVVRDTGATDAFVVRDANGTLDAKVDSGPPDAGCLDPVELERFFTSVANSLCEAMEGCCKLSGLTLDRAACVTREADFIARVVGGGSCTGATFDQTQVAACLDQTREAYAKCQPGVSQAPACNVVLGAGKGRPGEPCAWSPDCAQSPELHQICASVTDPNGPAYQGCQEQRLVGEGEGCTLYSAGKVNFVCNPALGLYCDQTFDGIVCNRYRKLGESCRDADCDDQTYCELEKCVPRPGAGETCVGGDVKPCRPGFRCDDGSKTCIAFKPLGEPCADRFECQSFTCAFGKCVPSFPWDVMTACE
jgi:hypothetical protein